MSHEPAAPMDGPQELLAAVRRLTGQVRVAQRATWFPLLVFAAITVAAIPIYRFGPHRVGPCRSGPGATKVCAGMLPAVSAYWPVALALGYGVIAVFYVRRSRRRGVGSAIRPYVILGIVLAGLLAAASVWRARHPLLPAFGDPATSAPPHVSLLGLATPAIAIGLALLVLAWVERNGALGTYSLIYLVIVGAESRHVIRSSSPWYFLPQLLIPAALLLLGSAGFAALRPATGPRPR